MYIPKKKLSYVVYAKKEIMAPSLVQETGWLVKTTRN